MEECLFCSAGFYRFTRDDIVFNPIVINKDKTDITARGYGAATGLIARSMASLNRSTSILLLNCPLI
jgi:hypothetical protein